MTTHPYDLHRSDCDEPYSTPDKCGCATKNMRDHIAELQSRIEALERGRVVDEWHDFGTIPLKDSPPE